MLDLINLIPLALEEITIAFNGGDWGYGALMDILGNADIAKAIVNIAAWVGGNR